MDQLKLIIKITSSGWRNGTPEVEKAIKKESKLLIQLGKNFSGKAKLQIINCSEFPACKKFKTGNMTVSANIYITKNWNNLKTVATFGMPMEVYNSVIFVFTKFVYSATMFYVQRKTTATIPVSAKTIYTLIIRTLDQLIQ
ncbi:hypothetical protein OIU78_027604 [Salix suchowensis]|nr:hypothetical protein OIU78_027604 [Salix suchowensis]